MGDKTVYYTTGGFTYMKKIIVNENQRGFLFENGKFVKMLSSGKHYIFAKNTVETVNTDSAVSSAYASVETLLENDDVKNSVAVVEVPDNHIALHFVNGNFKSCLKAGKYAFWKIHNEHKFQIENISEPMVSENVPKYIFSNIPSVQFYTQLNVDEYQKALLYYDNRFVKLLEPGTYYFWKNGTKVEADFVDIRLIQMNIAGQEVLTKDKVTLRISVVCSYRIKDYIKVTTEIDNYAEQIHVACQLAMRDYVGKYKLDEILENKEQMSEYVFARLKEKEQQFFVEIKEASVKDIILPGEIRDIMNTVLVAEKKAQANVITRREEVASTRSLLNTAKLMDENQTLYKLKELEYLEKICDKVGNISVSGNGDIISQLANMINSNKKNNLSKNI